MVRLAPARFCRSQRGVSILVSIRLSDRCACRREDAHATAKPKHSHPSRNGSKRAFTSLARAAALRHARPTQQRTGERSTDPTIMLSCCKSASMTARKERWVLVRGFARLSSGKPPFSGEAYERRDQALLHVKRHQSSGRESERGHRASAQDPHPNPHGRTGFIRCSGRWGADLFQEANRPHAAARRDPSHAAG